MNNSDSDSNGNHTDSYDNGVIRFISLLLLLLSVVVVVVVVVVVLGLWQPTWKLPLHAAIHYCPSLHVTCSNTCMYKSIYIYTHTL